MKQGIFPVITGLAAAICWCGIAQAQPAQEPHSPVTIRGEVLQPQSPVTILRGVQTPRPGASSAKTLTANDYLNLTFFLGQEDQALGLTLTEANDELREQLKLPREQGVVVSSLAGGGPADLAGLKLHDILLFLDEKPIRKPDELSKLLKAAGEKEVPLELMRAGKMQTIQVKPVYRVTLAPTAPENPRNYIGLSGGTLDETLRSHLKIPADLGFPVTSVIEDGPAAKAGIKTGDIILAFNTQPVESVQQLSELVQAYDAGSGPAEIEVQRGGETRTFAITPEPWKQRPETDWVEAECKESWAKPSSWASCQARVNCGKAASGKLPVGKTSGTGWIQWTQAATSEAPTATSAWPCQPALPTPPSNNSSTAFKARSKTSKPSSKNSARNWNKPANNKGVSSIFLEAAIKPGASQ